MIEHRPWGYFIVLLENESFKTKRLVVYPGQQLSYQRHHKRDERWIVLGGEGVLRLNNVFSNISKDSIIDVNKNQWHSVCNTNKDSNLVIFEIQFGSYLEEDDIERTEDIYGRV